MTITITDAALGLAETVIGGLMLGAVVVALAAVVLGVIRDSRLAERDGRIEALETVTRMLDRKLADSRTGSDGYKAERDEYINRIEHAIATLKGEHEDEVQS